MDDATPGTLFHSGFMSRPGWGEDAWWRNRSTNVYSSSSRTEKNACGARNYFRDRKILRYVIIYSREDRLPFKSRKYVYLAKNNVFDLSKSYSVTCNFSISIQKDFYPFSIIFKEEEKKNKHANIVVEKRRICDMSLASVRVENSEFYLWKTQTDWPSYNVAIAREIIRKLFNKYRKLNLITSVRTNPLWRFRRVG